MVTPAFTQSTEDTDTSTQASVGLSSIENVLLLGDYRDEIRTLEAELLRVRQKKNTLSRLLSVADEDMEVISAFEPVRVELDSELASRFLSLNPSNYSELSDFSDLLEVSGNSIYVDRLSITFQQLETENEGLFLELAQLLETQDIDFRELEFLLGSRLGRGGCSFIARRISTSPDIEVNEQALQDCKTDIAQSEENSDDNNTQQTKMQLFSSAIGLLDGVFRNTTERENSIIESLGVLRERIAEIRQVVSERRDTLEEQRREITPEMFQMITVTLLVFAAIMTAVMFSIIRLSKPSSDNEVIDKSITYPIFLELVTVFVLTVTILILGLANKMDDQALAALIGGISGYVLGRMNKTGNNNA